VPSGHQAPSSHASDGTKVANPRSARNDPAGLSLSVRARWLDLAIVAALAVVALVLRLRQLTQFPVPNETADEYAFLWAGWSWLHSGVPTSWSWKPAYDTGTKVFAHGTLYRLVTPWMDHPPLFALVAGAAGSLSPAREMLDVPLRAGRLLAALLGTASVVLLYALARPRYGRGVAALAALLLAAIPTIVLANRLVVAEALLVPFLLVGLFAAERAVCVAPRGEAPRDLSRRGEREAASGRFGAAVPRDAGGARNDSSASWLVVALVAAALASLAKVPGVFVGLAIGALLFAHGARRHAALPVAAAIVGLVPYVVYGLAASPATFLAVISDQSGRSSGIEVLPLLLTGASTGPVSWRDAWFPLLWLALAFAAYRRDVVVTALVVPYLVVMVAVVDQSVPRVWYREPLFPGLCLAGAIFLKEALATPGAVKAALIVFGLAFGKLAESANVWQQIGPVGQRLFPFAVLLLAVPMLLGPTRLLRCEVGAARAVAVVAGGVQAWNAEATYPRYTPPPYEEVAVPTSAGASILRYRAAPDLLRPGDSIRVSVVWKIERGGTYQTQLVGGSAAQLEGRAGDEVAVDYTRAAPAPGDLDLTLRIDGDSAALGSVRVR
jgi:4-amino-4-deoxy-L-arabinose transferase-like glycosyltransferase